MRHRKIDADRILERLLKGEVLTPLKVMDQMRIVALSQRIGDLRNHRGYDKLIRCPVMKTRGGKRCCHYHIPTCYLAEARRRYEKERS